jgi:hypothetical protein
MRTSGTHPASAMAPIIMAAVCMSVWVCSMSTISYGSPTPRQEPGDDHAPQ